MPLVLPRFYAIIDRSIRPELPLAEIARILSGAGVRLIQVRAKSFGYAQGKPFGLTQGKQATSPSFVGTSQALLFETRQLLSLLPPNALLIVNDRADVALLARIGQASASGVHLGQEDLPVAAARSLLGTEKLIGLSTHNSEQVRAGDSGPADYLAFGPIFPTATKADTQPVVGLAQLREVRRQTPKPLVAIGGITPENAAQVIEAGADAVAVISGWLAPRGAGQAADDIPQRLEEFRRALGRLE